MKSTKTAGQAAQLRGHWARGRGFLAAEAGALEVGVEQIPGLWF